MSIINPRNPAVDVQNNVTRIKANNLELCTYIDQNHRRIFNMVWHDEEFSAKEIVDGFGTDAADLFTFSGMIQNMLASLNPNYVPCIPPKEYVINDDGTVTVEE